MDTYPGCELTISQLLRTLELGELDRLMKLSTRCDLLWSTERRMAKQFTLLISNLASMPFVWERMK